MGESPETQSLTRLLTNLGSRFMCGIAGYLDKTPGESHPVGERLVGMLAALACRGPDSAGVALYGPNGRGQLVVRVKLGGDGTFSECAEELVETMRARYSVRSVTENREYVRFVVKHHADPGDLLDTIESAQAGNEVISMGSRLEIIKQVGSPQNLDASYGVSAMHGTHGIGHTRLSTESRVDLSHSQPFWSVGHPDVAIVHNGHITNYHKLRRRYEQHGVRFRTDNDSEIIAIYLGERLGRGASLEEALTATLTDFDGSFSYLAATADGLGYAKDPYAFKPLLMAETDDFVAIATEEIALRHGLGDDFSVRETQAKEVRVWRR